MVLEHEGLGQGSQVNYPRQGTKWNIIPHSVGCVCGGVCVCVCVCVLNSKLDKIGNCAITVTSYMGCLYFFGMYGKRRPIAISWYQVCKRSFLSSLSFFLFFFFFFLSFFFFFFFFFVLDLLHS